MPWRWAISNNSTIAHSTTSGLGSAGCRILFIVAFISVMHFCEAKRYIHPSDFLKFSLDRLPLSVQNCTLSLIADLGRMGSPEMATVALVYIRLSCFPHWLA